MIKSIELTNWKTHLNSKFEFENGTNVLVGSMGSGKTSVMDGICFALFGTFPALQQRRISLQEIIMSKPNQMDEAMVKIVFKYGGKEYAVERTIKTKGSSEAKLFVDGKFVAGPKPKDVNLAVENTIEINYNLFSRAVYSEQNQIDYFLRLSPSQRKEKFDELLELDRYENARSGAVSALNRLRGIAEDKGKWLEEMKRGQKEMSIEELEKSVKEKEGKVRDIEEAVEEAGKKLGAMKERIKAFQEKEKEFNELNESVSKKSYLAEDLEKEIMESDRALKGIGEKEIKKDIEEKHKIVKTLEVEIAGLEESGKEFIEKAGAARQEIRGNEAKAIEINELTKQVKGADANCPVCKSSLDKDKKEAISAENKALLEKLSAKNNGLSESIALMGKKEEDAGKAMRDRRREKEKLETEAVELEKLFEQSKKIAEKKSQSEKLRKEVEIANKKLKELDFDDKEASEANDKLVRAESGIEAGKKEKLSALELLENAKQQVERVKKIERQITELEEAVKAIEESCGKLNIFINSLRETQAQLRESLIETLNQAMDSIWPKVYPYGDYSSAKMAVENGNYELVVKNNLGDWVRVEGILSGGERSSAAICIRIAFSLVLAKNLSWIILDEPTHNLDATAVSSLSRMMRDNMPEIIDQVFVITHDKEMEKAASGKLYMLNRNKENDQPTIVETLEPET